MRRQKQLLMLLVWVVAAVHAASQRCDLVSQPSKCLDLATLNGATIHVPANTTRIPTTGLVLCGIPGTTPQPTDIVYVIDQTLSLRPDVILPGTEDTSGFYGCRGNAGIEFIDTIVFHTNTVAVANPATTTRAGLEAAGCQVAGDPYTARATAVQAALAAHAGMVANSYAATVNFGPSITLTQDSVTKLTPAGLAALQATVPIQYNSGTNYQAPLTWGRILLYGGASGTKTIAPSPNRNKAIIIISDGRPNQPNNGVWRPFLNASNTVGNVAGYPGNWTTSASTIPPVYGIYLGTDQAGLTLDTIAQLTGGMFASVPPEMPDSLSRVIQRILGTLIRPATPDTLVVRNLTNGQTSIATSSSSAGTNAYRMNLDSLVGLNTGANQLTLSLKESGQTINASWTVQVADGGSSTLGADSLLTERCGPASGLSLAPDKSGLAWADTVDRNLVVTLKANPQGNTSLPVTLTTLKSSDREVLPIPVPATANKDSLGTFKANIPWQPLTATGAVPGDLAIRAGLGWDTAYATFQMPRDRRDTASAKIALHRPTAASLLLTPSVDGPSGRIDAVVVDSEATGPTLRIVVRHRLGDTLPVTLSRGGDGVYRGSFAFAQGQTISLRDTILQAGPLGAGTDSVTGVYKTSKSTSLVQPASVRLRFLNAQNIAVDSLGFDLAVGSQTTVTVQVWIGGGFCSSCGGLVRFAPSDPALKLLSTAGAPVTSQRLSGGQLSIVVRGTSPVFLGDIVFTADSLGAAITARPIRVLPPAPDSVVYQDMDGDGRLDRAVLYSRLAWWPGSSLQLPWPDSTHFLPWQTASLSVSRDTLQATFDLDPQGTDVTGFKTPATALWRWDATFPWQVVPVKERIAPVPTRATLSWGSGVDTLRVWPSEPLSTVFPNLSRLVGRKAGSNDPAVVPRNARVETGTGALLLLIPSDSTWTYVQPGDSVRFLSGVKDDSGNAPGSIAKHVVVEGTDPTPKDAILMDTDADGRADRVVVRLRSPLRVTESVGIRWPDTLGVLQERIVPVAAGVADSGGLRVRWDLEPFAFGATSCPVVGCDALGALITTKFGSEVRGPFAVRDGVDPIPLWAGYRFSADGTTSDTLVVRYSEAVKGGADPWVSLGKPSLDSMGHAMIPKGRLGPGDEGRTTWLLVDSASSIEGDDSLRIAARAKGGTLSDVSGNTPGKLAYWVPIQWGAPPPVLRLVVPHPIAQTSETVVPSEEPPVNIMVRQTSGDSWVPAEGSNPPGMGTPQGESRFSGVVVRLNRIPETLGMYIYDNLGVLVLNQDLSSLSRLAGSGAIPRSRRGDYEVWLAWDGKDGGGKMASTGIYTIRVYGWVKDQGKVYLINQLKTAGLKISTKTGGN